MTRPVCTIFVWMLCAVSASAAVEADGETFKYSGRGTRTHHDGGAGGRSGTFDFSVHQRGCSWRIVIGRPSTFFRDGVYTPIYTTTEYQSDGHHIIKRHDGGLGKIAPEAITFGSSKLFTDPYPTEDEPGLQAVWTGFASGCYFGPFTRKARSPFLEEEDAFSDPVLQPDYIFTNEPGVPGHQIILRATGFLDGREPDGRIRHDRLGAPFDKGYVVARGHWTPANIGGERGSNFVFTIYSPSYPAKTEADVALRCTVECVITNRARERLVPVSIFITNELAVRFDRDGSGFRENSRIVPVNVAYINGTRFGYQSTPPAAVPVPPSWIARFLARIYATSPSYRIAVLVVMLFPVLVVTGIKLLTRPKSV